MTVASQAIKVTYNGNGSTTLFPITFAFNDSSEIGIYYTNALGVMSKVTTNFNVDLINNRVVYPVDTEITPALITGTKLTLIRETEIVQELELETQGYFTAVQAEAAYDKITRIAQELSEKLSRCVSFPLNETPTELDTEAFLSAIENAKNLAIAAQAAAELARTAAQASYDSFDDRYLGAKTSDPSLDNDGDELQVGALYFNSTLSKMRIWNGVVWESFSASSTSIKYPLLNNQTLTNVTGLSLDSTVEKSAFFKFEIERIGGSEFRQTIDAQAVYLGSSWTLTFGLYSGSEIVQDSLISDESITLSIDSSGQFQYSSGNLTDHTSTALKAFKIKMEV
jgi:hypothetical protein